MSASLSGPQSIASPGPAMKPSSDIHLFTTTLPFPMLVSLILFLSATAYADAHDRRQRAAACSAKPGPSALLVLLSESSTLDRHAARGSFARKEQCGARPAGFPQGLMRSTQRCRVGADTALQPKPTPGLEPG